MKLPYKLRRSGKNPKIAYYLCAFARYLMPKALLRRRLAGGLRRAERRADISYIHERVAYYNKLTAQVPLSDDAPTIGELTRRGAPSVYFFDSFEFTRWFPTRLRWNYLFGDVIHVPDVPSIVKSRPLSADNANSVLLNMDKVRHFCFLNDRKEFVHKRNTVIFRGDAADKPRRLQFLAMYRNHPMCDLCDVSDPADGGASRMMTLYEHLDYKFIMALEGNDVASNLKWVMSSNSIAVMPRPTCETWFMEGQLIPNVHYIEIRSDYSDLIERVTYYIEHPTEAQRIIDNAHRYVEQFRHPRRERLISLMVLQKYFEHTNAGR